MTLNASIELPNRKTANPSPSLAALIGIIVYALVLFLSPTTITQPIDPFALLLLILIYLSFFIGAGIARTTSQAKVRPLSVIRSRSSRRRFLAVTAVASILVMFYDRFIARGASLTSDMFANRDALLDASTTIYSVIGAILLPACYLFLFEVFRDRQTGGNRHPFVLTFAIALALAHPIIGLFFGSRSTLFSSLIFITAFSLYFSNSPINWRALIKVGFGACAGILFLGNLFLQRLDLMNMSAVWSMQYSVYAFTIQPSVAAVSAIDSTQDSYIFIALFSLINFAQYYCHGLLEFLFQVGHESEIIHSKGAYLFFIPYKFASMFVTLPNVFDIISESRVTVGTYTSFFGPVHSDFGWLAPAFMFAFGFWSERIHRISLSTPGYVPLSILLAATAFFFPSLNLLLFGQNFYIFFVFLIYGFWDRWIRYAN